MKFLILFKNLLKSASSFPKTARSGQIGLCIFVLLLSFFFIRVIESTRIFQAPSSGDDGGYFAYTEAIFLNQFDWCDSRFTRNPTLQKECDRPQNKRTHEARFNVYTPGPALLLFPVHLFGFTLEKTFYSPPSTLPPFMFWSFVGTYLFLLFGALLIFHLHTLAMKSIPSAWWWTLFYLGGNMILFYVFRRPLMAHAAEFFIFYASSLVFVQTFQKKEKAILLFLTGLGIGFLTITKQTNLFLLGVVFSFIFFYKNFSQKKWRDGLSVLSGLFVPMAIFFLFKFFQTGTLIYQTTSYNPAFSLENLLAFRFSNLLRIGEFFLGVHWGLFGIMPIFIWMAFLMFQRRSFLLKKTKENWKVAVSFSFFIFLFLNVFANLGTHMSYGYRLLLPVFYLFHLLFLYAQPKIQMSSKKIALGLFLMLLGAGHLLNYQSNPTTLTLTPHFQRETGVRNPLFRNDRALSAPQFLLHSYHHQLKGRPLLTLGASPLFFYPLFLFPSLKGVSSLEEVYSYYKSEKRKVNRLSDLKVLYHYHFWVLFFTGLVAVVLFRRKRRS